MSKYLRTPYGKMRTERTFNNRKYILAGVHRNKKDADDAAAKLRRPGNLARVTKSPRGYTVWFTTRR